MPTINQLYKSRARQRKHVRCKVLSLQQSPQKKGVCLKIFITTPKKPNSAQRKAAEVMLSNKKKINAYIPGMGHQLQQHSTVLIRGGRTKDLPGYRFKIIRGKFDATPVAGRVNGRSKYGVTKLKQA